MSMLRVCSEPGCTTLTLGRLCIDHEPVQSQRPVEVASPAPVEANAAEPERTAPAGAAA
jgi:hypothetical protein